MSEGTNGRPGLFTSPSPEPVEVSVGKLTLLLGDPPLEYLEQTFMLVSVDLVKQFATAMEGRPALASPEVDAEGKVLDPVAARVNAAVHEAGTIAWAGKAFSSIVSNLLRKKLPAVASAMLAQEPSNLALVAQALDAEKVSQEQFAAWVAGQLRARQVLAMGEALLYVVGVEELGKRWRSIQTRFAAAMGRAPASASATLPPQGSPSS